VVSGAAIGIDDAAHRGAVNAGGATAAVLACGPERTYPRESSVVLRRLWAEYVVLSEVPPGSSPTRRRFLARNRIIAGLARGTVLVEAAIRSGALNTATWTELLSRPVMGVPGPVVSAPSEGVHQRIRSGGATLVTHGSEVLEQLGASGEHLLPVPRAPERPRDRLSDADQHVLEQVPVASPAALDSIADLAARHVRDVDAALRRLQGLGFVEQVPTGWRQCRGARNAG
jgi:DNA processing protein